MMTNADLLDALGKLLPAQFDELLYCVGAPAQYFAGPQAAPISRIVDFLRWADQAGRRVEVEKAWRERFARAEPARARKSSPKRKTKLAAKVEPREVVLLDDEVRVPARGMTERSFHISVPQFLSITAYVRVERRSEADEGWMVYVVDPTTLGLLKGPAGEIVKGTFFRADNTIKTPLYGTGGQWYVVIANTKNVVRTMTVRVRVWAYV